MKHVILGAVLALPAVAAAQTFPSRPVMVISGTNVTSHGYTSLRAAQPAISAALGQPLVIELRLGAGGQIAARNAKESEPDGHTLVLSGAAAVVYAPHFIKDFPFDTLKDFSAVTRVSYNPSIIAVSSETPGTTLAEFVEHARRNPGKLVYGSIGIGSSFHLLGEQLNTELGVRIRHLPYKVSSQGVNDLVANRIQMFFPSLNSITPVLPTGKVKLLAVVSAERLKALPDLPAIGELVPKHRLLPSWIGLLGPAGLPAAVANRLNRDINAALRDPALTAKMDPVGTVTGGGSPREFAQEIREGYELVGEIVKSLGMTPK